MRDLALLILLLAGAAQALLHPWVGVMLWTWISIMSPHRLTWSAYDWPVGMVSALVTLIGLVITTDRRRWPASPLTLLLFLFMVWMAVSTAFALEPASAWPLLDRVWKILFMLIITLAVLHTRRHIEIFLMVITGSLAFFGVKGGLFTLMTGGQYRVWGPPESFIADNNELALALVMTIPLLRYLQLQATRPLVRWALMGVMACCVLAILGSHSRGAVLAAAAMSVFLWWRAGCRPLPGLTMAVVAVAGVAFMPYTWETRISSIKTYEQDLSVQGRFLAWETATEVASARLTGGGFGMWTRTVFAQYNPDAPSVHAAHSIYFQVLGEHGVIGFGLFMSIWLVTWFSAGRLYYQARGDPALRWVADMAAMVQVSLVAYAVGGAFYSLAYFDLPYDLAAVVVLLQVWAREQRAVAVAPRPVRAVVAV